MKLSFDEATPTLEASDATLSGALGEVQDASITLTESAPQSAMVRERR